MRKPYWAVFVLVLAAASVPVWYRPPDPRVLPSSEVNASETYSNILPEDYVGPATCGTCHEQKFKQWSRHPHSRMNQLPDESSVKGNFSGVSVRLPTGTVRFSQDGSTYLMNLEKDGKPFRRYRVTRTVGSRFMQFYVGILEQGPEPTDDPLYREHMLPFAYWFKLHRWLPKNYFDPDGPDDLKDGIPQAEGLDKIKDYRPYQQLCMNCHNTFPYAYRIFHREFVGFPDALVRAAIEPLSPVLSRTVPVEPTVESFVSLNGRLDPDKHLVSLGISCESCHFGGREHALNEQEIRFLPTSPYVKLVPTTDKTLTSSRKNPATVVGICAQCHSGNGKMFPNGACAINSREALDFHAGACTNKLSCVSCHEPHTAGVPSGGPTNPAHLALCVSCHSKYQEPARAEAHGRHTASTGVNCLDCHMPRYTQGVDEVVRSHRITVPVEESMASRGMANACNLCHLDKSIRWTMQEMEKGWNLKLDPRSWTAHYYGGLDNPVGDAWLRGTDTGMRLVAMQAYARSPLGKEKLAAIVRSLNDPEPINRVFATFAVERITGKPLDPAVVDITAPPARRARQIEALLASPVHAAP